MQDRIIAFLTENMKEMEIELRAQSIALDALGAGIVAVCDLQDAMRMARQSEAMLAFIERKYDELSQLLPLVEHTRSEEELSQLLHRYKASGYRQ